MSITELEALISMSCDERYDYSVGEIVDQKELWILVNSDNQFLKLYAEDEDFEYVPVWPTEALARNYAKDESELQPKGITLPIFLKKWVTGLQNDGLELGIFPAPDGTVWITDVHEFKQDLQDEMSSF